MRVTLTTPLAIGRHYRTNLMCQRIITVAPRRLQNGLLFEHLRRRCELLGEILQSCCAQRTEPGAVYECVPFGLISVFIRPRADFPLPRFWPACAGGVLRP